MGKKPVLALVGALWVGLALTGCGEARSQYRTPSTFTTKNPAPAGGDATASQGWNTKTDAPPAGKAVAPADPGGFGRMTDTRSPSGPTGDGMPGVQRTGMGQPPPPPPAVPMGPDGGRMGAVRDGNPPSPSVDQQTNRYPPSAGPVMAPLPPPPVMAPKPSAPQQPPMDPPPATVEPTGPQLPPAAETPLAAPEEPTPHGPAPVAPVGPPPPPSPPNG
jgi:hypothetical protein